MKTPEEKRFTEFTHELFRKLLELDPQRGTYLGLHEYDGQISVLTRESIASEAAVCKDYLARLTSFERDSLSPEERFDYDLIEWALNSYLFNNEVIQGYRLNPMTYAFMFSQLQNYINREYADFDERLKSIIALIDKIPYALKSGEELLDKELPAVLCDIAISFSKGYEDFFNGELLNIIQERSSSQELVDDYKMKTSSAIKAFEDFVEFLKKASSEECKSYILGKEKFMQMLKLNEQIEIPFDKLKKMGLDELKRLQEKIKKLEQLHIKEGSISKIEHDHPSAESLVDDTHATLKELVEFIREKNIVNLPDKLNCIVAEMPRYMNFGFAAMDTAGPFEKSDESYYYVNLPDENLDEASKEEWLTQFNYPTLKIISIHEAFPGHYTHFLNANKNFSDLSKLFMSYSYVEGWAHYTEEMMIDLGYGDSDYKVEIGMLLEALIRCCRYLAAIGIHCEGMSIEEAAKFFVENAYMAEVTAMEEAKRGAFDPGYLNYTLGKLLLIDLKEKYFEKFGDSRSLKDFHDDIVNLGAPTYRVAENYLLN